MDKKRIIFLGCTPYTALLARLSKNLDNNTVIVVHGNNQNLEDLGKVIDKIHIEETLKPRFELTPLDTRQIQNITYERGVIPPSYKANHNRNKKTFKNRR